jgi:hypothetical protein
LASGKSKWVGTGGVIRIGDPACQHDPGKGLESMEGGTGA